MNYLRLAIAILFAAFAQCSHADTIPTFNITQVSMVMNEFGGVTFTLTGPRVTIIGEGAVPCFNCPFDSPGSPNEPPGGIFVDFYDTAIFGGKSFDPTTLSTDNLFDNGGGVNPTATGGVGEGDSFLQFKLTLPRGGSWQFDFVPDPSNPGASLFNGGTFSATATLTPEPATVSLLLTGLVGIAGIIKKKARRQSSESFRV